MNTTPRPPSGGRARLPPRLSARQRRGLAVAVGAAVLAAISVVSVLLAPDAGAPRGAAPARPAVHRPAACARAGGRARDFPVSARIHDGPDTFEAGGPSRTWAIDLVNRTSAVCRHVYPVVVLVDEGRALRPEQVRLEFHDGARWRGVPVTHTDRDENVAAFGEVDPGDSGGPGRAAGQGSPQPTGSGPPAPPPPAFPGFLLRPGATSTVRVRLALAADTEPTAVTAVAVVVQRHGDDGDWVGESARYRFEVVAGS